MKSVNLKSILNKSYPLLQCLFCKNNIKLRELSFEVYYCFCDNCKSEYVKKNDILFIIKLHVIINDKRYIVELDLIKNKTSLIAEESTIYVYDQCIPITPQNIKNKIKTWLIVQ